MVRGAWSSSSMYGTCMELFYGSLDYIIIKIAREGWVHHI